MLEDYDGQLEEACDGPSCCCGALASVSTSPKLSSMLAGRPSSPSCASAATARAPSARAVLRPQREPSRHADVAWTRPEEGSRGRCRSAARTPASSRADGYPLDRVVMTAGGLVPVRTVAGPVGHEHPGAARARVSAPAPGRDSRRGAITWSSAAAVQPEAAPRATSARRGAAAAPPPPAEPLIEEYAVNALCNWSAVKRLPHAIDADGSARWPWRRRPARRPRCRCRAETFLRSHPRRPASSRAGIAELTLTNRDRSLGLAAIRSPAGPFDKWAISRGRVKTFGDLLRVQERAVCRRSTITNPASPCIARRRTPTLKCSRRRRTPPPSRGRDADPADEARRRRAASSGRGRRCSGPSRARGIWSEPGRRRRWGAHQPRSVAVAECFDSSRTRRHVHAAAGTSPS